MQRHSSAVLFLAMALCTIDSSSATAQGLIFNLPEDGAGVEFEGKLILETVRPELEDGREVLEWTRTLSIKSVGREDGEFEGTVQPCRWIEIKVVTGSAGAGGIDAGLVGARIYKFLVPESKVSGNTEDADGIPNSVLPVLRGFRRLGEEPVEEISSRGMVVYPTICLLANYESPETVAEDTSIESVGGRDSFDSRQLLGEVVRERPDARSTNTGRYWVSADVPFGLAGWDVKVVREIKATTADRSTFQPISTIACEMKVREILDFVESELITDSL